MKDLASRSTTTAIRPAPALLAPKIARSKTGRAPTRGRVEPKLPPASVLARITATCEPSTTLGVSGCGDEAPPFDFDKMTIHRPPIPAQKSARTRRASPKVKPVAAV